MVTAEWTLTHCAKGGLSDDLVVHVPLRLKREDARALFEMEARNAPVVRPQYNGAGFDDAASAARSLLVIERRRQKIGGCVGLFSDPAWFLMVDLFVRESEGNETSISSAVIASGVPPTTGLRCLTALVNEGKLIRRPDPADERRVFVVLSAEMRLELKSFFTDVFELVPQPSVSAEVSR